MAQVREAVLAGTWYPGDGGALAAEVDAYLAAADPGVRPAGRPLLAVVPHAGYVYSGRVAGRVFGLLEADEIERAVVMAPSHRMAADRILLSGADRFTTPLGDVDVDGPGRDLLTRGGAFRIDDRAHAAEHAIEIVLPFLQRLRAGRPLRILPMLVPPLDPARRREAAAALAPLREPGTLLVVSSDFTHYGADYGYVPFVSDIPASLERLDSGAVVRILGADAAGLIAYGDETGITMCGLEAAAVALEAGLPAGYEAALIDYARSADRDGDYTRSVSYAGILFCSGSGTDHDG